MNWERVSSENINNGTKVKWRESQPGCLNKNEKRELQRKRLMDNKAYQTMSGLTRYMDRYYLDTRVMCSWA